MPAKKPRSSGTEVPMAKQNGQPDTPPDGQAPSRPALPQEEHVEMELPEVSRRAVLLLAGVVAVLLGGLFLLGWLPHQKRQNAAKSAATAAASDKPIINVMQPKRSSTDPKLALPANVEAMQSTSIYARTNGYIKEMLVDIGDPVKKDQPLARIATPEVDAELEQADAALKQAEVVVGRATNEFKFNEDTYTRYQGLEATGGVTEQQLDERRSAYNIANSNLKAANANVLAAKAAVKRLTELQKFQEIVAPFDGTVTARNYDLGALVSASGAGGGRELFRVAQTTTLRVFVNVPQAYVSAIENGQEAELLVSNQPGKPVKGKVVRSAEALDPATRTLRLEVHVPNKEGKLFAGMFGQVRFTLKRDQQPLVVPTSALLFGADGLRLAVVEANDTVKFRPVTLGRDFGTEAEVVEGVSAADRVIVNPGDRLIDGLPVQVAPMKPGAQSTTAPSK